VNTLFDEEKMARINADDVTRLVVGLSGGIDSVVLLHALVAAPVSKPIVAIHINHGLQKEANSWQQFCEDFCRTLEVELEAVIVEVDRSGSLEENARRARYSAFEDFLKSGDLLLLAHHADDQLETILFNLFRGSEAFGVRGMPLARKIDGAWLFRPLLDTRRSVIEAYSQLNNLVWVEDASNQDIQMDRNYLRHELLPAITARFPSAEKALLNGLKRDRVATRLIEDIAKTDLDRVLSENGGLQLEGLLDLVAPRIVNLLREYLHLKNLPFPSGKMLRECAGVMAHSRIDTVPVLNWLAYEFRRHGDAFYLLHALDKVDPTTRTDWVPGEPLEIGGGTLKAELTEGNGILAENVSQLEVRFRQGGEKIKLDHSRKIKKLFQENNVPEWLRCRMPLVFRGDELIAIPGIPAWNIASVVSKSSRAHPGEIGWKFIFDIQDRI